jgi:hypothetical protein
MEIIGSGWKPMSRLIPTPEGAHHAFVGGATKTALALCVVPLLAVIRTDSWSNPWRIIGYGVAFVAVAAILGGVVCALWALVRRWAYRRVTEGPPPK